MTLAQILNGPKSDRSHEDARNGIPMTAAEVRHCIEQTERETKSKAARRKIAELGSRNIMGKISPEGVALYKAYAAVLA